MLKYRSDSQRCSNTDQIVRDMLKYSDTCSDTDQILRYILRYSWSPVSTTVSSLTANHMTSHLTTHDDNWWWFSLQYTDTIFTRAHAYTRPHIHMHIRPHIHATHACTHVHTYTHKGIHRRPHTIFTLVLAYTHPHIHDTHTHIHTHTHAHIHTYPRTHIRAYTDIRTYTHTHIHDTYTCTHVHTHVHTPGNFRGFEKPSVHPQIKFSFVRVALSWFSKKWRNVRVRLNFLPGLLQQPRLWTAYTFKATAS